MKKLLNFSFIISTLILTSCKQGGDNQQQTQGALPFPVIEVPTRTVTGHTTYPVSIEGTVNSAVRAKVSGYITDVLVDAGERVRKGQILFKLETESLSQEATAARANVNAAQVEVDKLKPLVEKNIISPVQLETAKARLAQAKANYNSIAANIDYANIKSPVDGYIGSIAFREGALISPNDPNPLTRVSNTEEVFTFFSMNEREYIDFLRNTPGENTTEKLKNFPPVQLELVNGEIYEETGTIETVSGQIDPATGTVSFRAKFPNPSGILANGGSGKIRIPKTYEDVPVIPELSTFEQQGKVYAYRVENDSLAISTLIEVQDRINNLIIITSGLKKGDKVVAKGVGKLRNNTSIQPQPVPFDSIANTLEPVFK
ncbi:efflux RND transporter periplasmic adaptor subunit [Salegentibacter sp. F14]